MKELMKELSARGADLIKTIDISMLPENETRGYHAAILIAITLSPDYIAHLSKDSAVDYSEFAQKEKRVDELAEWAADFIAAKGYKAFAQSEKNLLHGFYSEATKTTVLPHKKIAIMAGLGWIGKNNLLVTPEYGSALCMCTVLTDAPVPADNKPMLKPVCGQCTVCQDVCPAGVIHGTTWEQGMNRDRIVDVYHCYCCLKCLAKCSWTQRYMKNALSDS